VQTDDEFIQDIRNRADTVFHPSCTCMMGPDQRTAVVDARCRVYGVGSLRVVDTSIFPTVTSGNTNGPTIMAAEKAADMILTDGTA
jgi:choline dehydrogenase